MARTVAAVATRRTAAATRPVCTVRKLVCGVRWPRLRSSVQREHHYLCEQNLIIDLASRFRSCEALMPVIETARGERFFAILFLQYRVINIEDWCGSVVQWSSASKCLWTASVT